MKIINHEKMKEIILTNEEKEFVKIKKFVIYVKNNFVLIKIMKKNLKKCEKSEVVVIIQENL